MLRFTSTIFWFSKSRLSFSLSCSRSFFLLNFFSTVCFSSFFFMVSDGGESCFFMGWGTGGRGAQRFWSPADLAFSLLSPPYPPAPSRREGGNWLFYAGASPLASQGLNGRGTGFSCGKRVPLVITAVQRDSKPCRLGCGTGKQCRQPREGDREEELRRLRWSSPRGWANKCRTGVQPPLRAPQRQSKQVPQGQAPIAFSTAGDSRYRRGKSPPLPSFPSPAIAAQGKPRRRRAERREQTEQYAGEH